jgi:hypothetical protein
MARMESDWCQRSAFGFSIVTRTAPLNATCTTGGTAAAPAYLACLEAMTRARTKELAVGYAVRLK